MLRAVLFITLAISVARALPLVGRELVHALPSISGSPMSCEFCEASLGDLVHEAVEAGWMGEAMYGVLCCLTLFVLFTSLCRFKVCPSLAQKYNIPYEVCCTVAFLIEGDAFNHIVPDSIYYCEKLKV